MLHAFLFEVYSDEIPACMQLDACARIEQYIAQELRTHDLQGHVKAFVSLRHTAFLVSNLTFQTEDTKVRIKGPSNKAPPHIIERFIQSHGAEHCQQELTPKGDVWCAYTTRSDTMLEDSLEIICKIFLEQFYWPKRMRWHKNDDFTWIRPIHHLTCLLDDTLLSWTFHPQGLALETQNTSHGHPALQETTCTIINALSYESILEQNNVLVCPLKRLERVRSEVQTLATERGYTISEEDLTSSQLLGEVIGMTEHPHVLLCSFSEHFLHLPTPFLLTTLKYHQRCFPLFKDKALTSKFIVVLDGIEPNDVIREGHERVAWARLSDALFFWNQDLKQPLECYNKALKHRIFFENLGTMLDKVRRLEYIATHIDASSALSAASALSKADLATQAVGEFPELQGIMGRYYALEQNIDPALAQALEEQYWPLFSNQDLSAQSQIGGLLGLIDRMDTLVGFFGLGRYPTGSKDPMALRRSAYGWVRLSIHHRYSFTITQSIRMTLESYRNMHYLEHLTEKESMDLLEQFLFKQFARYLEENDISQNITETVSPLRFSKSLAELYDLATRLHSFISSKEGIEFLVAYKRVLGLLNQEQETLTALGLPDISELSELEERSLWHLLQTPWSWENFVSNAPSFAHNIHNLLDHLPVQGTKTRIGLLASVLSYTRPLGRFSSLVNLQSVSLATP